MVLDFEDRRFGYDEAGTGRPLLLLHGFPYRRGFWEPQLGALPARTVAVDLPGFGESSALSEEPNLEAFVTALRVFCRGLGIVRPAVAGHSFGGYIALAWARLFPGEMSGICLVASRATADSREAAGNRLSMAAAMLAGADPAPLVEAMPAKMLCRSRNRTEGQRVVRSLMDPLRPEGIAAAQKAMANRPDASGSLPAIGLPALVLAGEEDQLIPLSESGIVAAALPQGRLVVPPKSGHFVSREAPKESNAAISDWLSRID
jgi:pimeloyl-ACP methyl ester carboxylesterase